MAKSSSAGASVDPFASAKRKVPAASKKAEANIIPAQDFTSYDGGKFTLKQSQEAIVGYAEGHEQFESGKAMKDLHRPTVLALARTKFAEQWLFNGGRPKNPALTSDPTGKGAFLKVLFFDSANKLDENSYATLANLIGAKNAEQVTVQRDDFLINPEMLTKADGSPVTCLCRKDGKVVEQPVLQAIKEALQERFAPSPEVLANLFQVIPQFHTMKGLIDKGPALVTSGKTAADAQRLAQFIVVGGFTTQVRAGADGSE